MADKGAGAAGGLATTGRFQPLVTSRVVLALRVAPEPRVAHEGAQAVLTAPIPVGHGKVAVVPRAARRPVEAQTATWVLTLRVEVGRARAVDGAK